MLVNHGPARIEFLCAHLALEHLNVCRLRCRPISLYNWVSITEHSARTICRQRATPNTQRLEAAMEHDATHELG